MNKKYEIQCAVRRCTTKRGRKERVTIHRFPKRGDTGKRWIEACAISYLSRLEYRQIVERKFYVLYPQTCRNLKHFYKIHQKYNHEFCIGFP